MCQLRLKVFPFMTHLAARHWNSLQIARDITGTANLSPIEFVSAMCRFVVDNLKISGDGMSGIAGRFKSQELRMVDISAGSTL
jgi:hypothetical protein